MNNQGDSSPSIMRHKRIARGLCPECKKKNDYKYRCRECSIKHANRIRKWRSAKSS